MAWNSLLNELHAQNYPVPSANASSEQEAVPVGFIASGADLRGIPRVTHTVAYEKYPRTELLNW
jgi:hypothetical protein